MSLDGLEPGVSGAVVEILGPVRVFLVESAATSNIQVSMAGHKKGGDSPICEVHLLVTIMVALSSSEIIENTKMVSLL